MQARDRTLALGTVAVVAGRGERRPGDPLNAPVTFASVYRAGGAIDYAREGNPTWSAFETALGALEGGTALAFASGMGAASAVLEGLRAGATVVAPYDAYLGLRAYLAAGAARDRFAVRLVDIADTAAVLAATAGADLLWIESPTNPLLAVADLAALCAGAHRAGATVVVDSTFATPLLQRPLELGADAVVHSVTKFLSGHSDLLLGAVVCADERFARELHERRALFGAVPGPMETYLALRGLRTLDVRLERAQRSAALLAERLGAHAAVSRVRYPGFGTVLAAELTGGAAAADAVCAAVRLLVPATSLGGVETTLERRNRWPGEEHVPPSLLRISVGCEHAEDLWADLDAALEAAS